MSVNARLLTLSLLSLSLLSACGGMMEYKASVSPRVALGAGAPTGALGTTSETGTAAQGRRLVRNAWIELEVKNEEERQQINSEAQKIARSMGGYIADESTRGFTMRVPAAQIEGATARLGRLAQVVDRGFSVQEVTAQYVDLVARLDNAKRLKRRLQALLERSNAVKEVLAVEKELARVTETLERLEGQLRVLKKQIRLARIDVRFTNKVSPGPIGWIFYGLYRGVKWLFVWD